MLFRSGEVVVLGRWNLRLRNRHIDATLARELLKTFVKARLLLAHLSLSIRQLVAELSQGAFEDLKLLT